MKYILLVGCIVFLGCRTNINTANGKPLARIHFSIPFDSAALYLTILNNDKAVINTFEGNKQTKAIVLMPKGSSDTLLPLIKNACTELRQARKKRDFADALTLFIALEDDFVNGVTIINYDERSYSLTSFPILMDKLHEFIPAKHWKRHRNK